MHVQHWGCVHTSAAKVQLHVPVIRLQEDDSVYEEVEVIVSSQQVTDSAAVITHWFVSPSREIKKIQSNRFVLFSSLLASGVFSRFLRLCNVWRVCFPDVLVWHVMISLEVQLRFQLVLCAVGVQSVSSVCHGCQVLCKLGFLCLGTSNMPICFDCWLNLSKGLNNFFWFSYVLVLPDWVMCFLWCWW